MKLVDKLITATDNDKAYKDDLRRYLNAQLESAQYSDP